MWEYTEKVMDLFHHPHNMGAIAVAECDVDEAIAVGEIGSIVCGDALRLHLRIDKKTETILDARFQTFGCASAIASSSALTDLLKGKTLDEALKLTNREIADYLGGLPQEKMHCSVMGQEALESAISNYRGIPVRPDVEDESSMVCQCFAVTEGKIRRLIVDNQLTTAEEVTNYIKAGGGCGACLAEIDDLLAEINGTEVGAKVEAPVSTPQPKPPTPPKPVPSGTLTNLQKMLLIQQVLEEEVRPALAYDGGDVDLYDVIGDRVLVILKGACDGCPSVAITLKMAIEKRLRDRVSPDLIVEAIEEEDTTD
ncbi:Fe-S cluster assembly protein NifU [Lyngbya sp. CCY1209]|jgi:NifU-like protein|uniref:Fe-S cluster assembly protein NifU n=1 Tax=Lyngbya sp. CCY1209 TaxID=2886103 RepID=UPI002D20BA77|nr:Fe-S cluster assembly protein NifU [Lyngbya sp. CCY1209]MEB3883860.1 Fe-S cluster assembly protein NifU [Lyngbya sp. CCY1209]